MKAQKAFAAGDWRGDDAASFKAGSKVFPSYRFPFVGGLAIWARQTRDPRYQGVVFHLPCYTNALTTTRDRDDFTRFVWHISFCELHNTPILMAYPENRHSVLVVDFGSSISGEVYFE